MTRHRNRNRRHRGSNTQAYGDGHRGYDRDGDIQIQDNPFGIQGFQIRGLASRQKIQHPQHPNSRIQKRNTNDRETKEPYVSPVFDRKSVSPDLEDRSSTDDHDHDREHQRRQKKRDTRRKHSNYQRPIPPPPPHLPLPLPCIPDIPILDPGFFDDCKRAIDDLYTASLRVLSLWAQYSGVPWKADGFGAEKMEWEPCAATELVYINQLAATDIVSSGSGYQSESLSDEGAQEASAQPGFGCVPSAPIFAQEAAQNEEYVVPSMVRSQEYAEGPSAEQDAWAGVEHQHQISQAAPVKVCSRSREDWRNPSRDAGSYRRLFEDW